MVYFCKCLIMKESGMKKLAIFASGNGSNAQRIMDTFSSNPLAKVELLVSNREDAYALERARQAGVKALYLPASELKNGDLLLKVLKDHRIDLVILAGYLLLIPEGVVAAYPRAILNIHPALLPAYGGKGMYGMHVHRAVLADEQKESGISIHYVNTRYDEGDIIFQARCPVFQGDTPETLAGRIHQLEHRHYPEVISRLLETSVP